MGEGGKTTEMHRRSSSVVLNVFEYLIRVLNDDLLRF